ncbi:MAG: 3-dehydroquinate synthase [Muribaculaceae bacterium]|nr:3-dehydroquinate synthase [Muribaculaceae bacterium]
MAITFTNQVDEALGRILAEMRPSKVLVLADENTARVALPRVPSLLQATAIVIPAGDQHKTIDTTCRVWQEMENAGVTRHSLMVCLGGGMVTDLGGFAASTFKRGIPFVNVPTTLLAAVDAATGGKTGVNFSGLKNEIGLFREACHVVISTCFFDTLPASELLSGYAEMLKHAMLSSHDEFCRLLDVEPQSINWLEMLPQVEASVEVKRRIVASDPTEQGLRRVLNLGHTVGHALESLSQQRGTPVTHGHAVACGLVTEAVLSHMVHKFPSTDLNRLATFVRHHYGPVRITCNDYPALLQLMHSDKKSHCGEINCTLLRQCGDPTIDNTVTDDDMQAALDIYRDLLGI